MILISVWKMTLLSQVRKMIHLQLQENYYLQPSEKDDKSHTSDYKNPNICEKDHNPRTSGEDQNSCIREDG